MRPVAVPHVQRLLVESPAAALLAYDGHGPKKLHPDHHHACAFARVAPAPFTLNENRPFS